MAQHGGANAGVGNQRFAGGFNRGFGNYGYGGFGYPYGGFGYGGLGLLGLGLYGLGYGGYGGFGGYGGYGGGGYGGNYASYPASYGDDDSQLAQTTASTAAASFDQAGEDAFRAGVYKDAVYDWRHALVDDPHNGTLAMLLAQALFAQGSFNEAAGAVEMGMMLLPQEEWGVVVKNYKELYTSNAVYTAQLRALEKASSATPDDAGMRFLLGFHYNYLGYPTQAAHELEKVLQLAPKDELSKKLLDSIHGTASPTQPCPQPHPRRASPSPAPIDPDRIITQPTAPSLSSLGSEPFLCACQSTSTLHGQEANANSLVQGRGDSCLPARKKQELPSAGGTGVILSPVIKTT